MTRSRFLRAWLLVIALCALVFSSGFVQAETPSLLAARAQIAPALPLAQTTQAASAPAPVDISQIAPSDAPRVSQTVTVPPVPTEFITKSLGWMRISYPAQASERVSPAIDGAAKVKEHLTERFGQSVLNNVEVRIARSWDEMARLAPEEAPPPRYASGVAYSSLHLVLVTLVAPHSFEAVNIEETVRHELSHIALSDAVGEHHLPRWFQEGVAIHESGELGVERWKELAQASLWGTMIPLAELDRFPADGYEVSVAYAESGDFVRFLMRDEDAPRFTSLISRVKDGQKFDAAIGNAYTSDLKKLEYQWKEDVSKRYSFWPGLLTGSFLWVLLIGALGYGYMRRRRRHKMVMARWEKEEAFEDALIAARRAVFESELANPIDLVKVPVIQHDGRTHTLH